MTKKLTPKQAVLRQKVSEFNVSGGKAYFDMGVLKFSPSLPNGTYKLVMLVVPGLDAASRIEQPKRRKAGRGG